MTEFFPATPDQALRLLWEQRRWLGKIMLVFGALGLLYALLAPVEYQSEASLMPEFQAGSAVNLKRFGALADLVGIDLESVSNTEAIRPDLYPDVLLSTPFLLTVLNHPVSTIDQKKCPSLVTFLTTARANPVSGWFGNQPSAMPVPDSLGRPLRLLREQEDVLKDLRKRIVSDLDPQSGLIIIRVTMPDAEVAAQVCQQAIDYLRQYVLRYRTGKVRNDLAFVAKRRLEAKVRYDRALIGLAAHTDNNRSLFTQSARIEGRRLEAEHELAQTLFSELSRRYEQIAIKIQEETPILSVLEPPSVPARRSAPRRTLNVLTALVVGFGVGVVGLLIRATGVTTRSIINHNAQPTPP